MKEVELIYSPKNPEHKRPQQTLRIIVNGKTKKMIKGRMAMLVVGDLSREKNSNIRYFINSEKEKNAYIKALKSVKKIINCAMFILV